MTGYLIQLRNSEIYSQKQSKNAIDIVLTADIALLFGAPYYSSDKHCDYMV